jgi:hypothetical protein
MKLTKVITSAQLLALYTTPITVIPAPGAGLTNVLKSIKFSLEAGTAYDGIAAGENIAISYTNASGQLLMTVETDGFLTLAAGAKTINLPVTNPLLLTSNAAIVIHMLVGNVATGTGDLTLECEYDIVVL